MDCSQLLRMANAITDAKKAEEDRLKKEGKEKLRLQRDLGQKGAELTKSQSRHPKPKP